MSLLESALSYADNGIPVFPVHGINDKGSCTCQKLDCSHPGKHPVLKGGHKNATCDRQQIITWWNQHPRANIGVPTGAASGWYVVDVDQKNQGIDNYVRFIAQYKDQIPEATLKAHTGGGGFHLIYTQPASGQAVGSGTNIGRLEGIDFRGDGGYIVVPPSLHFNQKRYGWSKGFSFEDHSELNRLRPLPTMIIDLIKNSTKAREGQDAVIAGGRNDYLFKQACNLRRDGTADEHLFDGVWAKNLTDCKPPLAHDEVQQLVSSALNREITQALSIPVSSAPSSGRKSDSEDTFNNIMALTADHEFWLDEVKRQYVSFPVPNSSLEGVHQENWPICSLEYQNFLNYQYRQRYQKPVSAGTLKKVLDCLAGDVLFSDNSYEAHVRTARLNDTVMIDLTDANWTWIEITASGWSVRQDKAPVKFLRSNNAKPMPLPDISGDFECLPEIFRLKNQDDYILLSAWLMFSLVEGGPYPVLTLEGVAGSSKSTLTKQIRQLVDPRKPALQGMPSAVDDLFIQANNGHLIAIDNLSEIKQKLSDVLCGISSGTGNSKRELFTNTGEIHIEVCRPIILNSINPVVQSSDLADRCIRLSLPPITSSDSEGSMNNLGRLSAEEVDASFQQRAPQILGAICTAIQTALPNYRRVKNLPAEIRMADFARWGFAAGKALALGDRDFVSVLMANRQHNAEPFMENDMLNLALFQFLQGKLQWSGTPTELLNELTKIITPQESMDPTFPKTASRLTRGLNSSITTLKQFGIDYRHSNSSHKKRILTFDYTSDSYDGESGTVNIPVTWGYPQEEDAILDTEAVTTMSKHETTDSVLDTSSVIDKVNWPAKTRRVITNLYDADISMDLMSMSRRPLGIAIETTGPNPLQDNICLIQVSDGYQTLIIDVREYNCLEVVKSIMEHLSAVSHDAIRVMSFLQAKGISMKLESTQLAHHVLTGDCLSFESLAKHHLDVTLDKPQQLGSWKGELSEQQISDAARDAEVTEALFTVLEEKLQEREALTAYHLVRDAQPFVVAMQLNGIDIDQAGYQDMLAGLKAEHAQLVQQWQQQVPGVNINSTQQVSNWISRALLDGEDDWPKTQEGYYVTAGKDILLNKASLNDSAVRVVDTLLLPLKRLNKEISAFGDKFLSHIDLDTGRIHATFNLAGAVTGRMSCSKPNLQQIPRQGLYRKMFHAPEGYKLVIADYSQMELRIAAMIAEEDILLEAYRLGQDTHRLTAALILGKEPEEINKEERQLAKAINFGLLYGQGAAGLQEYAASSYGVSIDLGEANAYREAWFQSYPAFARWHNLAFRLASHSMMVSTPSGRKRYFESTEYKHLKGLRRTRVFNTPIQGGAAEVLLAAMALLSEAIIKQGYGDTIKPIAVIHDEIIVKATDACAEQAKQLLEEAMVGGMLAIFPTASTHDLVEAHIGNSWADK